MKKAKCFSKWKELLDPVWRAFLNNNCNSVSQKHLSENERSVDAVDNAMDILYTTGKGSRLNTVEKYYCRP
jgi:hypothetical protein